MPTKQQQNKYGPYTNVTLNPEQQKALQEFQRQLAEELGFEPSLGDTIKWLINHAKKTMGGKT